MNINQVAMLLNKIERPMIATNTSIKPDIDHGINYYKLRLNNDNNKWELLYCPYEKSKVYFIGEDGRVVLSTLALENWEAYSEGFRSVYYLYLLNKHNENLLKNKELDQTFTDEDYKTVLTGR